MVLLKDRSTTHHNWPANFIKQDLIDFMGEEEYSTGPVFLKFFSNVSIAYNSVAYTGLKLIKETIPDVSKRNYFQTRYLLKSKLYFKQVSLPKNRKYLLLTDIWSVGHFHFISDVLPKFVCLNETDKSYTLLLPDVKYLREVGLPLLVRLNGGPVDVIWMKDKHTYHISEAFLVDHIAASGKFDPSVMEFINIKLHINQIQSSRRVYVSRRLARFRKVNNEAEVLEVMKSFGFEICHAEDLSFGEQTDLFSSCSVLAGIHGAGLANCVFMKPGSSLIELKKKEYGPTNVGYWHLADALGHKYYYFNGEPDSTLPLVGKGCNLQIETSGLKHLLESIIS